MRIKIEIETNECKANIILDSADFENIDDTSLIKLEKIKDNESIKINENKNIICDHCGNNFTSAGFELHKKIPEVKRYFTSMKSKKWRHDTKRSTYSKYTGKKNHQCAYCGDWFGTGFISHQIKCKKEHKGIPLRNDNKHGEKPLVSVFEGSVDRKVSVPDNAAVLRGD